MAIAARKVPRVRSGASHRAVLVTPWTVRVTGIEFIDDYPMEANGNNRTNTDPDRQHYATIPEDFKGWGRGMPLTGWDWEGTDNLERAACYQRLRPVHMKVRLRSSLPAPTARTFTLTVTPTVDGSKVVLTAGTASVNWPAASQEQIVPMVALGGTLPNEVSRYHLGLTWSVTGVTPGGVIGRSNHKVFGIYDDPRDPNVSSESGTKQSSVQGLTKQRLDKLTLVIGGNGRRFPTPENDQVHRLVWKLCQGVNDSGPPHFCEFRAEQIKYGDSGPYVDVVDQWLMWLEGQKIQPSSNSWRKLKDGTIVPDVMSWTVGACISYVQLMKTMLASIGIASRKAWVFPKTTRLPDKSSVSIAGDSDKGSLDDHNVKLVAVDTWSEVKQQVCTMPAGYPAQVMLFGAPKPDGSPYKDQFEAAFYYQGVLIPGAFATLRYRSHLPPNGVGFPNALALLRWWAHEKHRFMAWMANTPGGRKYFDVDGNMYDSPYDIPVADRLPVP